jgi:hypothetical protein
LATTMKLLINIGLGLVILFLVFRAGVTFDKKVNGYRYEIRNEKEYASPMGVFKWLYVSESHGLSLIDPGTTIIEFAGRKIYSAQRGYPGSVPFAQAIRVDGSQIVWDDGEYLYHLSISPTEIKEKPNQASQAIGATAPLAGR